MTSPLHQIGPETSVNRLLEIAPDAIEVLEELGIDSCCGGALSLAEAAADAGVDCELVLYRIEQRLLL